MFTLFDSVLFCLALILSIVESIAHLFLFVLNISVSISSVSSAAATVATPPCAAGWVNANNYCYLFVNTKAVTWKQASSECDLYDASLLYFDNAAEKVL